MSPTRKSAQSTSASTEPELIASEPLNLFVEWYAALDEDEQAKFNELFERWKHTPVPNTTALLAYYGIDPNRVPANNAFYTDGFITFRKLVEADGTEWTTTGYRDDIPKLNDYPEGLDFTLAQAALRADRWKL